MLNMRPPFVEICQAHFRKKNSICAVLTALLVAWLGSGCDFPQKPRAVTISNPPVFRPSQPLDVTTLQKAMATVMTICREDLHLPAADPIEVRLYENGASFASCWL